MTTKKITTPAADDGSRHSFLPVHLDLVDRLTREAETLAEKAAAAAARAEKARYVAA